MNSFRDRIYAEYASQMQDAKPTFDPVAARRWGKAYDHYLRNWLPKDKNAACVDLACGGGGLLFFLKERGYTNISGVDVSPSQVIISKQVVPNVYQASVLDFLKKHLGHFDLITAFDIVEHFTKEEFFEFLDGCFVALKPGGRLVIKTLNGDSPYSMSERYGDFTHEVSFTPNSLGRLMKLCGFESTESREIEPPKGYSLMAAFRRELWKLIRLKYKFYNLVETGSQGSGVFTRIFAVSAVKTK